MSPAKTAIAINTMTSSREAPASSAGGRGLQDRVNDSDECLEKNHLG